MKRLIVILVIAFSLVPHTGLAQNDTPSRLVEAEVQRVLGTQTQTIIDDTTEEVQQLEARILSGDRAGEIISVENDYQPLRVGDDFFVSEQETADGVVYTVQDIDRTNELLILFAIFAAVVIVFGGWKGVRSLVSLAASFGAIIYILLPLLLAGYSPILVSLIISTLILTAALYITHGVSRQSTVALLSTLAAIGITALFAYISIDFLNMSGFVSDEVTFLNFNVDTNFDFSGLLLGGMIIGVLGVLDDIAITQVAVVGELKSLDSDLSKRSLFWRAVRVGRDHVGALINTLVLAYAGAALPLLLFFTQLEESFSVIVSQEIVVAEIARTLAGSIGLILTVPIATFLAAWFITADDIEVGGHGHH